MHRQIEANSSRADQKHNPWTKPHQSPPTQPSHQNDNQIDTIRRKSKRHKIMQADKIKRETRSEIEKARVNGGVKRSTGKLRSEGKKRTSMGAGVMTVMAITQLTSRCVTCGVAMEERER